MCAKRANGERKCVLKIMCKFQICVGNTPLTQSVEVSGLNPVQSGFEFQVGYRIKKMFFERI